MNVYYNRPSDRVSEGEPNRIARNFRLHPDRIADLDEIARVWNVTKARALEQMIEQARHHLIQRNILDGDETHPPPASFSYPASEPSPPDVLDGEVEAEMEKAYRAPRTVPKSRKRKPQKEEKPA